jgi:hypothetical protein
MVGLIKTSNSNFKGEGWSTSAKAGNPNLSEASYTHFREWLSKNRRGSASGKEIVAWDLILEGLQDDKQAF